MENLEAKIKERKREAIEKKIETKASTIAEFLGDGSKYKIPGDTEGRNFQFHKGKFLIKEHYFLLPERGDESEVEVNYLGQVVYQSRKKFEGENEITSYVPGEWEDEFNHLYGKAKRIQKGEEALPEPLTEEETSRVKWGL